MKTTKLNKVTLNDQSVTARKAKNVKGGLFSALASFAAAHGGGGGGGAGKVSMQDILITKLAD